MAKKKQEVEQTIEAPAAPINPASVSTSVGFRKTEGARWAVEVFEHQWSEDGEHITTTLVKAFKPASWSFAYENYEKTALDHVQKVSK